jgi:hypothetical protein
MEVKNVRISLWVAATVLSGKDLATARRADIFEYLTDTNSVSAFRRADYCWWYWWVNNECQIKQVSGEDEHRKDWGGELEFSVFRTSKGFEIVRKSKFRAMNFHGELDCAHNSAVLEAFVYLFTKSHNLRKFCFVYKMQSYAACQYLKPTIAMSLPLLRGHAVV